VGELSVDGRRLCVCSVPDPKSRMEGLGKLKIGGKKAHVTRVNVIPFSGRKVRGQGHQAD